MTIVNWKATVVTSWRVHCFEYILERGCIAHLRLMKRWLLNEEGLWRRDKEVDPYRSAVFLRSIVYVILHRNGNTYRDGASASAGHTSLLRKSVSLFKTDVRGWASVRSSYGQINVTHKLICSRAPNKVSRYRCFDDRQINDVFMAGEIYSSHSLHKIRATKSHRSRNVVRSLSLACIID